jgi:hypothetical protein
MRSAVVSPGHEPPACVDDGRCRAKVVCIASLKKAYGELETIRELSFDVGGGDGRAQIRLPEPGKSVALHLESVKQCGGGSVANQKVIEYGQAVGTALGACASTTPATWSRSRGDHGQDGGDLHGRQEHSATNKLFTNRSWVR